MTTRSPTIDSTAPTSQPATAALARAPEELELRPLEGMARWLGRLLHPIAFRMVSMVEQPLESMSGPLSPVKGYFRRDRHRHPKVDAETYRLKVTGVAKPREFTLKDLEELPWENRVLKFLHLLQPLGIDAGFDIDEIGFHVRPEEKEKARCDEVYSAQADSKAWISSKSE